MPEPHALPPTIFSPAQLERLVRDQLPADAQPNEKVVVGTVDRDGVQVVASFKNRGGDVGGLQWEFQAAARHDWSGDTQVGTKVILRWS